MRGVPDLTELFAPADAVQPAIRQARIASAPAGTRVMVTVRSVTGDRVRLGPCPFPPRGTLMPARGDRAWVGFDDDNQPVVLVWEPR